MIKHRILALYDSHFPHNIPLGTLLNYAKDFKPTDFILGGDNWDLGFLSHWNDANFKNIGFDSIRKRLQNEAKAFSLQLTLFQRAMPHAKVYYIEGNHEHWLVGFSQKYSQMSDLSLESLLDLKARGIELIPYIDDADDGIPKADFIKLGKLYFKHGHQYSGQNPVKQGLERSHKSVVMGHHHGFITWANHSDVDDKEQHVGHLVPCYRKRGAGYGHGSPNRWMNGFFWAYVKESGNFSGSVQLVSPEGKFITQSGKEYI